MWDNQQSPYFCESVAGRRPVTLSQNTAYAHLLGLLKVERREFRCLGLRVSGVSGVSGVLGVQEFKGFRGVQGFWGFWGFRSFWGSGVLGVLGF